MSSAEAENAAQAPKKGTKKPRYTKITQQELPACKPILEPTWVVFIFLAIGVIMIPIGVVCLLYGNKAVEVSVRYDQDCFQGSPQSNSDRQSIVQNSSTSPEDYTCVKSLTIPSDMDPPVFFWYQLDGYYQNHRRYVKSRDDQQLAGQTQEAASTCSPIQFTGNNSNILPCGLIAWSFFNDTYFINSSVPISESGIALQSDVEFRFANVYSENFNVVWNNTGGGRLVNTTVKRVNPNGSAVEDRQRLTMQQDERFIVWMRTAALPNFRKLWGKTDTGFKKGEVVNITIVNRYNTFSFNGKKSIVLGTTTWLGGKNSFLGIAYIVTGGTSVLLGFLYFMLKVTLYNNDKRQFGDISALISTASRGL